LYSGLKIILSIKQFSGYAVMVKVAIIAAARLALFGACCSSRPIPSTISVLERNQPDSTFGWGVVFSDQTLDNFRARRRHLPSRSPDLRPLG